LQGSAINGGGTTAELNGNGRPATGAEYALRVAGLSKTFGATRALQDVSIDIRPGEIHALMGQNGSGKSTLIKSLAGYHQPDHGADAELDGEAFDIGHVVPDGLRFVHQDLGLVLELSAQDNLALHGGFAKGFGGRVLWREQERETYRMLERFNVQLDIHQPLAAATPVERTVVAIAAALQGWHGGGGVLVLDEPTAVLPHDEVERLFAVVREVRKAGTAILYVSHRIDEIFQLADRVTILRGGKLVSTVSIEEIDPRSLAGLMVGEDVDPDYRAPVAGKPDAPVVLETRDVAGPLAARRRPAGPQGRDPRHRRARRRGRAGAAVRAHGPRARQGQRRGPARRG
jgi:ribose transport system ATP-binding protein